MLVMPRTSEWHELGWAIDHVMSAPNVRAKTQEQIAEIATRGGYKADRRLVGTYMRKWPAGHEKAGQPRSKPPFRFIWALIKGGNLTKEQAMELTDAWLQIHDREEREDLERLCAVLQSEEASPEAWRDMLDLEARKEVGEEEGSGRRTGGNGRG
ncbi:hypothetical protein [Rubrobacter calidifluminis]|uniref:hypothetical protein n=1 Tax=Rubrobacter calidifluminis TaxID=1392640 RepID=UPI00235FBF81|nr:hypothetical protein [Rubrobacter calidifluminis]